MNLLILDSGHAKNTPGKNNAKENFYEWQFNNDMQYKIKARCEESGIKVFLNPLNYYKIHIHKVQKALKLYILQ